MITTLKPEKEKEVNNNITINVLDLSDKIKVTEQGLYAHVPSMGWKKVETIEESE
jgi:imidazoleglycerol phosphate synthase glutamine amidotransferase subunit HisH